MTPHYSDPWVTMYVGDVRDVLRALPDESVHCVVTSPPYWGLRDYGVNGQLGLEATPEEYIAAMVGVFREVRRALRKDGTLWLNLGDGYASSPPGNGRGATPKTSRLHGVQSPRYQATLDAGRGTKRNTVVGELKSKDLIGMPWRLALALQADGWYLRSDIIWAKPNPMPESVTDRPTRAHEYVYLLARSARYYYDAEAVREGREGAQGLRQSKKPDGWATHDGGHGAFHRDGRETGVPAEIRFGRNLRSVWTIATQPYPGAHFATFPEGLVEPCIKAGTSGRGVCSECGAPWARETVRTPMIVRPSSMREAALAAGSGNGRRDTRGAMIQAPSSKTIGWRPTCKHEAEPVPATVLDPFGGSGTTSLVAERLGRRSIYIDLSADYAAQAMERIADGRREGTGAAMDMPLPKPLDSLWHAVQEDAR